MNAKLQTMKATQHLAPLPEDIQDRLREALLDRGEDEVCELLGISRIAVLRGASGVGVMRGTRAIIARGLDELDDADDDDAVDDLGDTEGDDDDDIDDDEEDADADTGR